MSDNKHQVIVANRMIRRFERSELILHWVNAVPFVILLITGALNILSRFKIYSAPFIEAIRIMHKINGVIWIVGIGYSFFFIGRELNIANTRDQLNISSSDINWAIKTMRSLFDGSVEVPPVGKFNIGQKTNALLVILYAVAFSVSGAVIWAYNTMLFPWYFHAALFFMAVFSLGGHLYLSFVHPSTRPGLIGIFNGMVPKSYIVHHHALMIKHTVNAHREPTVKRVFVKTERPHQEPGSRRTPAFDYVPWPQDRQSNQYRHVERVPVSQSCHANVDAHADADARLVAACFGDLDSNREESDMQKAWNQFGGRVSSRGQN